MITGYLLCSLQFFKDLNGTNGNPSINTINEIMGYSSSNIHTERYTIAEPHKNCTCTREKSRIDAIDNPTTNSGAIETITQKDGFIVDDNQQVYAFIDEDCPNGINHPDRPNKLQEALDYMLAEHGKTGFYNRQELIDLEVIESEEIV